MIVYNKVLDKRAILAHHPSTYKIPWPERGTIRAHLPESFRKKWNDVVKIIDCSEVFIERPKNLTARVQT